MEDEIENEWSPKDLKREIGILTIFIIIIATLVTGAMIIKTWKKTKSFKPIGKILKRKTYRKAPQVDTVIELEDIEEERIENENEDGAEQGGKVEKRVRFNWKP